jgi:hypothetical protein
MQTPVFQFYPTLLNEYHRFLQNPVSENEKRLFDRINRIPETDPEVLAKFRRGISFEDAVVKDKSFELDESLVQKARNLLPAKRKTQQLVEFRHKNIRFYGYADILGNGRVIDLKSTSNHCPGRHDFNFQNLYLYALLDAGFKTMEYVICDFKDIYHEVYLAETLDFEHFLLELEEFADFLLQHENRVTDKKIIQRPGNIGLFE